MTDLAVDYVDNQLKLFGGGSCRDQFAEAVERSLRCFAPNTNKCFQTGRVRTENRRTVDA